MAYFLSEYQTILKEHPEVSYYKRDEIAMVLSKGLSVTMREQPRNPVEYFANWLMKYNDA